MKIDCSNLSIANSSLEWGWECTPSMKTFLSYPSQMNIFNWLDFKSIAWDPNPGFLADYFFVLREKIKLYCSIFSDLCTFCLQFVQTCDDTFSRDINMKKLSCWNKMVVLSNIALFFVNHKLILLCIDCWKKEKLSHFIPVNVTKL